MDLKCDFEQVGVKGEALSLHTNTESSSVRWTQGAFVVKKQPLTWYKVRENTKD